MPSFLRFCFTLFLGVVTGCANSGGAAPPPPKIPPAVEGGTRLSTETALYPRVIRLEHNGTANGRLLLSYVTFPGGSYGEGHIVESTDAGLTWSTSPVGVVR